MRVTGLYGWIRKEGSYRRKDADRRLTGDYEVSAIWYSVLRRTQNRLGDNAAASTTASSTIGIDGSGGRGLSLGSVGGDGEESSEEIH
jgi:uncharacterized membrane protein